MPSRKNPAGVASPSLSPTPPTGPPGRGAWLTGTSTGGRRGCGLPPAPTAGDTAFHPGHNTGPARGSALPQRPAPQPAPSGGRKREPRRGATGTGKAAAPRPGGDAAGDARQRAMTRAGDGAGAVRLLPRHRQPGGRAVPAAAPPGRGVRGGAGARGGRARGSTGTGGCLSKRGACAWGMLGHRAWR